MKKITTAIVLLYSLISFSQIVEIPDPNFKNALLNYSPVIDTNGDGEIQESEALIVEDIDVSSMDINDLTGIEAFVNLEGLNVFSNTINELDISNNVNLERIFADNTNITNLNTSSNLNLNFLSLNEVLISTLDLSNNPEVNYLHIESENLSELILENNIQLNLLIINSEVLTELDISNNVQLSNLVISAPIPNLDLSNKPNLTALTLTESFATEIDLSSSSELQVIVIRNSQLSTLDFSENVALNNIQISVCPLVGINLANNLLLDRLDISFTNLTEIDLSNNVNLTFTSLFRNQLEVIDVSSNTSLEQLFLSSNQISSIDLINNANLISLALSDNLIDTVDLSQNSLLEFLFFNRSLISNLDLSNNDLLKDISIYETQIEDIDLSNLSNLEVLRIDNSAIRTLDLSNNPMCKLRANDNFQLEYVNLKNNQNNLFDPSIGCLNTTGQPSFTLENCPNLEFVCVDDNAFAQEFMQPKSPQTAYIENCNLANGELNHINGTLIYDEVGNGCDASDVNPQGLLVNTTDGINDFANTSDNSGFYSLIVGEGTFTTSLIGLPDYFTINPEQEEDTFSGFDQTEIADFCLQALGDSQDLSVALAPTNQARPGFNAGYTLTYENMGTTSVSGTSITLTYDDDRAAFDMATLAPSTQTDNALTWEVGDLNVFQIATIDVRFDIFAPPLNDSGDILEFEATISPSASDITPQDNSFVLEQEIVNSFDPNDITILEGPEIPITNADQYVHYLVRFQNTGTASAINVRVQNQLEEKLDWTSFRLLDSSHDVEVQLVNQQIDFVFDNINLPEETSDPEGSQGYILYEIKPVDGVVLGDTIDNRAAIYFDFNAPIITNTTSTTFVTDPLGLADVDNRLDIQVFPNPASDILQITASERITVIEIFDLQGRKVSAHPVSGTDTMLNVSLIPSGLYFLKMYTDSGNEVRKFLKK